MPSCISTTSTTLSKGGKAASAVWQVTLCDPICHAGSSSSVGASSTNCYRLSLPFTCLTGAVFWSYSSQVKLHVSRLSSFTVIAAEQFWHQQESRITESIFKASTTWKSFSTVLASLKAFHATARRPSLSESRDITWQTFIRPITAVKRTFQHQWSEQQNHVKVSAEFFSLLSSLLLIFNNYKVTMIAVKYSEKKCKVALCAYHCKLQYGSPTDIQKNEYMAFCQVVHKQCKHYLTEYFWFLNYNSIYCGATFTAGVFSSVEKC